MNKKMRETRLRSQTLRFFEIAGCAVLLLAGVAVFATPGFGAVTNRQTFEHSYPLAPGGSFLLENVNGSVQVEGWDRDEVEVEAVKTADTDGQDLERVKIDVDSAPGQVSVHTRYPKGEGVEVAVEYHVHVPYRVLLGSIGTVNGSVLVRGVDGGGDLRSVNGNVEVSEQRRPLQREDHQRRFASGAARSARRSADESRNRQRIGDSRASL